METRRTNKRNVTTTQDRVDKGLDDALAFKPRERDARQGASDKALLGGGTKIHDSFWYEFILVAQHIYREDEGAEVADVFEWLRRKTMDGTPISTSLLKRVNREIATELGPWE